jgi:hypothetical protein
MKVISIKELHETTGRYVREAQVSPLIVTDRGHRVVILKPFSAEELPGRPFPKRFPRQLPHVNYDSTNLVSEDRDSR